MNVGIVGLLLMLWQSLMTKESARHFVHLTSSRWHFMRMMQHASNLIKSKNKVNLKKSWTYGKIYPVNWLDVKVVGSFDGRRQINESLGFYGFARTHVTDVVEIRWTRNQLTTTISPKQNNKSIKLFIIHPTNQDTRKDWATRKTG